jgi:Flp pilus assembly protein TadG
LFQAGLARGRDDLSQASIKAEKGCEWRSKLSLGIRQRQADFMVMLKAVAGKNGVNLDRERFIYRVTSKAEPETGQISMKQRVTQIPKRLTNRVALFANALQRNDRGATAVEFGLICLPFFALLIATLQMGVTFFAQQALETAGDKAARAILTGTAQKASMTQAQFKTLACSKIPTAIMDCSKLVVEVQTLSSFSSADLSQPTLTFDASGNPTTATPYVPGAPGSIVMVRVSYPFGIMTGPLGFNISNLSNGKRLLMATSIIRTEPYS